MPSLKTEEPMTGSTYWRSLKELAGSQEYREALRAEFPVGVDLPPTGTSRRSFLQIMAASIALASATGCRWPKENIRPHTNRPDGRSPGVAVDFATSMDIGGAAQGLLVKSFDGRPIKIEGNDLHPINLGATDLIAQASVLGLYDPDRSQFPTSRIEGSQRAASWQEFDQWIATHSAKVRADQGAGFRILSQASSSPSLKRLRQQIERDLPKSGWVEFEAVSRDSEIAGTRLAFGQALRPQYRLSLASVVLDLGADLLFSHPAALKHARDYAGRRDPDGATMNRLYSIESVFSQTGAMADHRMTVASSNLHVWLVQLAAALLKEGLSLDPDLVAKIETAAGRSEALPNVEVIAKDLYAARGACLIATGLRQRPETHALVHTLNVALGNLGKTVTYTEEPENNRPPHGPALARLVEEMNAGQVETLVILGGNPAFEAPADAPFATTLSKVPVSLHLSLYQDETSQLCTWHVPRAHYLEAWGDNRAYDGTLCAAQPLIEPLFGGKSDIEMLALLLGLPAKGYELVRDTVKEPFGSAEFETAWSTFLDRGVREGTGFSEVGPEVDSAAVASALAALPDTLVTLGPDNLEIVLAPHPSIYDGRFANNGWLQEVPDFITKLTWDNALILSPQTAETLGVDAEERVTVQVAGASVDLPVYILPGQAAFSATVHLGFGRRAAGRVGNGVGVDAFGLTNSQSGWILTGAEVTGTGRIYPLASTQDHYPIDQVGARGIEDRVGQLIREVDLVHYHEDPHALEHEGPHHPPLVSPWKEHEYEEFKWGMTIDLNKCIGCNACVVACQSENNIPVVGKEQVLNGREMHWIRIDRYFHGEPETAEVAYQPLACQHCENAPCEQVCPVGATMHDSDGLNVMVYNRCVGTRYCSNNCPYKVRRFNFFNYNYDLSDIEKMVYNPDVTVRSRGVMEKCTFCVQRISSVKIEARNQNRPIEDGEIVTACQQACPSRAIEFGDLNNKESKVAKLHSSERSYAVLEELNIKPRTRYLARVRNTNPAWVEA